MPRPHRPLAPDLTYHVTARGNRRQEIFRDDQDRRRLLQELGIAVRVRGWQVGTYCLMPNHLHVVLTTPKPDLSDGLQQVLGRHARAFNDRHELDGHLFQGRFHARVVAHDDYHLELFRYVALNPVRAGLCTDPLRYLWSAHAALLGKASVHQLLDASLAPFSGDREGYAHLVASAGGSFLEDLLGEGGPLQMAVAAEAGFTQHQIADALGIPRSAVQRALRRTRGV